MKTESRLRVRYICGLMGNADVDRCNAMTAHGWDVTCIQKPLVDEGYRWDDTIPRTFRVLQPAHPFASWRAGWTLVRQAVSGRCDVCIFYGYQKPSLFFAALLCRLLGRRVISINDSKFEDQARTFQRDAAKVLMLAPYHGFLAATDRAAAYISYFVRRSTSVYLCAIDQGRFLKPLNDAQPAPLPFDQRPFMCAARFLAKKNFRGLLNAYSTYLATETGTTPRRLVLCGYGEQEEVLRGWIAADPLLRANVDVSPTTDAATVTRLLAECLCLVLVSEHEEFGIIVTESLAAGRPVIVSPRCGATDIVRPMVNGLIVAHDDPTSIAEAMAWIGADEERWNRMCRAGPAAADRADVRHFCTHVARAALLA
jgi:glycosyltransferase involved in cell wall biosynthesis